MSVYTSAIQSLSPAGHDLGYDGPKVAVDSLGRAYAVWGRNAGSVEGNSSNVIEVYVAYLREKLGRHAIETVRGAGYRLRTDEGRR